MMENGIPGEFKRTFVGNLCRSLNSKDNTLNFLREAIMYRIASYLRWALLLAAVSCSPAAIAAPPEPEKLSLWPEQSPIGEGKFEPGSAVITVHRPEASKANGASAVICPGGGYGGRG